MCLYLVITPNVRKVLTLQKGETILFRTSLPQGLPDFIQQYNFKSTRSHLTQYEYITKSFLLSYIFFLVELQRKWKYLVTWRSYNYVWMSCLVHHWPNSHGRNTSFWEKMSLVLRNNWLQVSCQCDTKKNHLSQVIYDATGIPSIDININCTWYPTPLPHHKRISEGQHFLRLFNVPKSDNPPDWYWWLHFS